MFFIKKKSDLKVDVSSGHRCWICGLEKTLPPKSTLLGIIFLIPYFPAAWDLVSFMLVSGMSQLPS